MQFKFLIIIIISVFIISCSKEPETIEVPPASKAYEIYNEAVLAMNKADYFYASNKFSEAELILPKIEYSAKAQLMSAFCLYQISFYDDALLKLENFLRKYPADENIIYANYLIALLNYEQILDEERDISPLLLTKNLINLFLKKYPNSEYSIDLKFKLGLVNNQLAAKEMYIAKFYIKTQKWIPAVNRLKTIKEEYSETIFIEEALHRLVEVYYLLGLKEEALAAASILGYNYNSSEWYKNSYKVLNKEYKIPKKEIKRNDGLIKRTIKKILG